MQDNTLDDIRYLLEDIRNLLLAINRDKLDNLKKGLLKPGSVESQVYEFCDGTNTAQDIATKVQKSPENISAVISNLRRKGLIRSMDRNGKRVIVQVF